MDRSKSRPFFVVDWRGALMSKTWQGGAVAQHLAGGCGLGAGFRSRRGWRLARTLNPLWAVPPWNDLLCSSCGALPKPRTRPAPAWLRPKPHACWGWVTAAQRGRLRLRRRPAATRGVTTILPLFDPLAFRHANMLIRADSRVVFNDTLENLLDVLRVFVSPPDWEIVRWFRFPVPS